MRRKEEISLLKELLSSGGWEVVKTVADEYIKEIQANSPVRETDSETLKEIYIKEGRVRGIRELIQEIYNQISNA